MGDGVDNELFIDNAKSFEAECSTDRRNAQLRKALKRYDPSLDLLWNNVRQAFWVVVRLRPGEGPKEDGYPLPLFPVGVDPRTDDVLVQVHNRRLKGRGREVGRRMREENVALKQRQDKEAADNAFPNFGEYAARLEKCDDSMTQRHLMEDMAKERQRARTMGVAA